ncbi:MAG: N-acetylmuramoyl-L-alanine amidase [Candidatus Paceibacterota bacterium]|jgi:N-acetylmuramoyl-L-alanine amidase
MDKTKSWTTFKIIGVAFLAVILLTAAAMLAGFLDYQKIKNVAGIFFIESTSPKYLLEKMRLAERQDDKVRVLIVPGHEPNYGGAEYRKIKEREVNLEIANKIFDLLSEDYRFKVYRTRDNNGWSIFLKDYFDNNMDKISLWKYENLRIMKRLMSSGKISSAENPVYHNNAAMSVADRLYGINKWANENKIDIVLHVHINDVPRKNVSKPGSFSGIAIYIPEKQYSNSRASKWVANYVLQALGEDFPTSNLPQEQIGVIEDQDLIAIGRYNTLDPVSMLVEYGYIYEPSFNDPSIKQEKIDQMAKDTVNGIINALTETSTKELGVK